ncbi:MAG: hypothetical protein ACOZNI_31470 [Myxococcota bacterium]
MTLALLLACASGPDDTGSPASDDEEEPSPGEPADPDVPYGGCVVSAEGYSIHADAAYFYEVRAYDVLGAWASYEYDGDADGEWDERGWAERDAASRMVVQSLDDDDPDELPDRWWDHDYGDDDLLDAVAYFYGIHDEPDARYAYTYDEAGLEVRVEWDDDDDGDLDGVWTTTWVADGDGWLEQRVWDDGADDGADALWHRRRDADRNVVEEDVDEDADGQLEWSAVYTYADGALITWVVEVYTDEGYVYYTFRATYDHDVWGRPYVLTYDYDLDRVEEYRVSFDYVCEK